MVERDVANRVLIAFRELEETVTYSELRDSLSIKKGDFFTGILVVRNAVHDADLRYIRPSMVNAVDLALEALQQRARDEGFGFFIFRRDEYLRWVQAVKNCVVHPEKFDDNYVVKERREEIVTSDDLRFGFVTVPNGSRNNAENADDVQPAEKRPVGRPRIHPLPEGEKRPVGRHRSLPYELDDVESTGEPDPDDEE